MNPFFELIRTAIGTRASFASVPVTRDEWEALQKVCGEHNLLAVTFPVIDELHDLVDVPLGVYSRWAMVAEKTQKKNKMHQEACKILHERFLADGFHTCVLKGEAAAALYPRPELRQSGDIDLWIDGERSAVVDYLRERYPLKKIVYHHCDASILKGVSVEVHFTPTWMNSPVSNKKLQAWFRSVAPEQFANLDTEHGYCVPSLRFDAVYMLIHIFRHFLDEGIGLRQLLDYYYVLKALDEGGRAAVCADLRNLGFMRFAAGVMYILKEVFDAPEAVMLTAADEKLGAFLLEEVLVSGNFGRFDPRNAHEKGEGKIRHTRRKVGRALRFFRYFPSEVFWMPWFMLWQYFWRRKHNYLYKGR